ncbi:MAG: hypothetical protein GY739_05295, partial [Mesoflavibacter sp.]|nr:hypothetical protein [Mesoflavibacter sp.]
MSIEFIPHKYQKGMVKFMNKVHKCYLAAEPGLGKTAVSLMRINQIKQKTLVVAPLRIAYGVWPAEIEKWTNFQNIKLTVLHGPDKEKAFLSNRFGVYVINPEGLKWLDQMVIKHKRFPWKVLVIDEAA